MCLRPLSTLGSGYMILSNSFTPPLFDMDMLSHLDYNSMSFSLNGKKKRREVKKRNAFKGPVFFCSSRLFIIVF